MHKYGYPGEEAAVPFIPPVGVNAVPWIDPNNPGSFGPILELSQSFQYSELLGRVGHWPWYIQKILSIPSSVKEAN